MRGVFVTGTDTGVGKTVVAAAVCAALRARGERVAAWKPVVTGVEEAERPGWPPDHELLALAAGGEPGAVAPLTFGSAVSPHLAAELAGQPEAEAIQLQIEYDPQPPFDAGSAVRADTRVVTAARAAAEDARGERVARAAAAVMH